MVVFNTQTPILLTKRRGVNDKITPVVKAQQIQKYNKDQRRTDEQKANDVKTTAVILRISQQGKSKARTG
jgi:hypothetical protein